MKNTKNKSKNREGKKWALELGQGRKSVQIGGALVPVESASSPLVGFGELSDNTIKGLTSLLSVSKVQQEKQTWWYST